VLLLLLMMMMMEIQHDQKSRWRRLGLCDVAHAPGTCKWQAVRKGLQSTYQGMDIRLITAKMTT
jgi:hypothetical protein